MTVSGSQSAAGLVFQSSGAPTLTGSAVGIGSDGINVLQYAYSTTPTAPVSIFSPVTLWASQTWTNNSSNALTVYGPVSNNGNALSLAGSGNITVNGAWTGSGTVNVAGGSQLQLGSSATTSAGLA